MGFCGACRRDVIWRHALTKAMTWAWCVVHSSVTCMCFCSHMIYSIHVCNTWLWSNNKKQKKNGKKILENQLEGVDRGKNNIDGIHFQQKCHRFLFPIQLFSSPFVHFQFIVVVLVRWPGMDESHNSSNSFWVDFYSKFIEKLKQPHEKCCHNSF